MKTWIDSHDRDLILVAVEIAGFEACATAPVISVEHSAAATAARATAALLAIVIVIIVIVFTVIVGSGGCW
jgi:hypothetical protein